MSVRRGLIRLYPAAFRDRWGEQLDADHQGADREGTDHERVAREEADWVSRYRAHASLLAGAADMWLHPVIWPARHPAQRRERATGLALAVAALVGLLGHAAGEAGAPLRSVPGGAWSSRACAGLLLLGLVLVAPLPRLTRAAASALLGRAVRRLAPPVLVAAAFVFVANRCGPVIAASPWRLVAVAGWWVTLAVAGVQACRVLTGLDRTMVRPPRPRRLGLGLWSLGAASALSGSAELSASLARHGVDGIALAIGVALVLGAWAPAVTLRDLRSIAAT